MVGVPSQLSSEERALCNGSLTVSLQALLSLVGLCTLAGAHQHGLLSGDTPGALCRDFRQVWLAFPSLQGLCQTPQSREKLTERNRCSRPKVEPRVCGREAALGDGSCCSSCSCMASPTDGDPQTELSEPQDPGVCLGEASTGPLPTASAHHDPLAQAHSPC